MPVTIRRGHVRIVGDAADVPTWVLARAATYSGKARFEYLEGCLVKYAPKYAEIIPPPPWLFRFLVNGVANDGLLPALGVRTYAPSGASVVSIAPEVSSWEIVDAAVTDDGATLVREVVRLTPDPDDGAAENTFVMSMPVAAKPVLHDITAILPAIEAAKGVSPTFYVVPSQDHPVGKKWSGTLAFTQDRITAHALVFLDSGAPADPVMYAGPNAPMQYSHAKTVTTDTSISRYHSEAEALAAVTEYGPFYPTQSDDFVQWVPSTAEVVALSYDRVAQEITRVGGAYLSGVNTTYSGETLEFVNLDTGALLLARTSVTNMRVRDATTEAVVKAWYGNWNFEAELQFYEVLDGTASAPEILLLPEFMYSIRPDINTTGNTGAFVPTQNSVGKFFFVDSAVWTVLETTRYEYFLPDPPLPQEVWAHATITLSLCVGGTVLVSNAEVFDVTTNQQFRPVLKTQFLSKTAVVGASSAGEVVICAKQATANAGTLLVLLHSDGSTSRLTDVPGISTATIASFQTRDTFFVSARSSSGGVLTDHIIATDFYGVVMFRVSLSPTATPKYLSTPSAVFVLYEAATGRRCWYCDNDGLTVDSVLEFPEFSSILTLNTYVAGENAGIVIRGVPAYGGSATHGMYMLVRALDTDGNVESITAKFVGIVNDVGQELPFVDTVARASGTGDYDSVYRWANGTVL